MLDDLKYIHDRDSVDTLGIAEKQWQQLSYQFQTGQAEIDVDNIVYAGMGGSALAALISQSWPGYNKPFEIVRNYDLPDYVSARTFFIACSYSGNTEETLSALIQAERKGAHIAVIAGGGKLFDIAKEKGYTLALLPKAEQPRYAVLYNLKALVVLLSDAQLVNPQIVQELEVAAPFLQSSVANWLPTIRTSNNFAKQLALECIGKSVVIYAGPNLYPAAYKWKISFNENAKQVAWVGQYPEFKHNEFIGWSKQPIDKPYAIIELKSRFEHERIQKSFIIVERLLSGLWPHPNAINVEGASLLEQLLWVITIGDFVTLYTALLNGLNPAPVELVEKLKQEMSQ
ncbi:MAG: SIS domain-containing protein [Candidatus Saccharimonadales bacterium]